MELIKSSTARFTDVVEACGAPESFVLWTAPEKDPRFTKARKENRVMTIKKPAAGTTKEFGQVGFLPETDSFYLIFPKALDQFENKRIVGIKYDLIKESAPVGKIVEPVEPHQKARKVERRENPPLAEPVQVKLEKAEEAPEPLKKPGKFKVTMKFTAIAIVTKEIGADSIKQAREKALKEISPPDFSLGELTKKIVKVDKE